LSLAAVAISGIHQSTQQSATPGMLSPEDAVRSFNASWIAGDIEAAIQFVAEDCVYALYISDEILPFGGETRGRESIKAVLHMMRDQFEYLLYRPQILKIDRDMVRQRVEFMYRHNKSGEILSGNFRLIFRVRDGLLVRGDEYHDRPMVEAFLRLFAT
jgi:ketosteroid isomerase-like protein